MREIKFRAWDKNNSDMVYFDLAGRIYAECAYLTDIDKDSIIMQYTGLLDKNGEEIYEGDIIEYPINQYPFDTFKKFRELVEWKSDSVSCGFKTLYFPKCEIIGNFYQNPELLEAVKE